MNYMSEVAKVLGVELDEEFSAGTLGVNYVLTNDGLFYAADRSRCDHILVNILTDRTDIKRKHWKPNIDDEYYFIEDGEVWSEYWCDSGMDHVYYKIGNCYRRREQAKKDIEKWNAFFASDEVLEV